MISIFLTILFASSAFSTVIILAACAASARSVTPTIAKPMQRVPVRYTFKSTVRSTANQTLAA